MRAILRFFGIFACAVAGGPKLFAQLSPSAYRTLGQPNLNQNGINLLQGHELNGPAAVAIDARNGATHIYISDSANARVLGWRDVASYQVDNPADLVLGQPSPSSLAGNGDYSFNGPFGMAVDPATGNLYVADSGNNRILRFPAPFSNPTNFTPDAVIGQAGFTTNGSGTSASALNSPVALAFDSAGNLWVSDNGNNRVVRFPAATLASLPGTTAPQADTVLGQKGFATGTANAGAGANAAPSASGFYSPQGIAFDPQNNLYVADFQNLRVLYFPAPITTNEAATVCFGQSSCTARVLASPPTSTSMGGPVGLAYTSSGVAPLGPAGQACGSNASAPPCANLYVAIPNENRVLAFPFGDPADVVYGQTSYSSSSPNADSATQNPSCPLCATANGLASPEGVAVDATGNVYVADSGNNRVLMYASGSRSATNVWGQASFTGNGVDEVKADSMWAPYKMAIDYSQSPFPLYVADTKNNRVLVWQDSIHFQSGAPADLVIGQPNLTTGIANVDNAAQTPTATSLSSPSGLAVDQTTGDLYVADFGNNRVLHYPRPVNQSGRITPDIVLGQSSFTSSSYVTVTASSLNGPSAVALAPGGALFVSDSKNNRVLEYAPNPTTGASAIQVYGQPNLNSGASPVSISPQTLLAPAGIFIDPNYNLYVTDTGANRMVVYADVQANTGNGLSASFVFGQAQFNTFQSGGGSANLNEPLDVALDSTGAIYVADYGNSRVVIYPPLILSAQEGTAATSKVTGASCTGATPLSMCGPAGIYLDRNDTLYAADSFNNRVVQFLKASTVVSAASYLSSVPVAPGSFAALFIPSSVLNQPATTGGVPFPISLAGIQVVVNGSTGAPLNGPLHYAGNLPAGAPTYGQINFQVPSATPLGTNVIAVQNASTGELLAGGTFSVGAPGPGLFAQNGGGSGLGSILNGDGVTVNSATNPATPGSVVSLYGTGPGAVSPPVPDGQPAPSSPLSYAVTSYGSSAQSCEAPSTTCVIFNDSIFGTVQFSGLAPGFVGLWQINVQIPASLPAGEVAVKVTVGGVSSNTVAIVIK
jgi:uncharacterized protein (TIGR03437 family)